MPPFTVELEERFQEALEKESAATQDRVHGLMAKVQQDPWPDGKTKFWEDHPPAVLAVIEEDGVKVSYYFPNLRAKRVVALWFTLQSEQP